MPAEPEGVGQQWREPPHRPVDRDVIDLHAAFDQQILHVAIGQVEAQVPAQCDDDHLWREAEPGNPDLAGSHGLGRIDGFTAQVCLDLANAQCNGAAKADLFLRNTNGAGHDRSWRTPLGCGLCPRGDLNPHALYGH